jgi:hypothetical protein
VNDAALPVVYADESNNTGENLRDENQPVFTVAGVHLDDDPANDIVEAVVGAMQKGAGEPKYSLLARRPRGRALLMSAFAALPDDSVKVFVADKNFMTVSKIIDLGIEPLMFADGYNMHADESARALAHMVALVGPVVGDSHKFTKVLEVFVRVVLQRDLVDAEAYVSAAEEYLATVDESDGSSLRTALLPIPDWLGAVLAERNSGLHPDTLDPAIPAIVALCREFFDIIGPLRLVHDESKVIDRNKDLLLTMDQFPDPADPNRPMQTAGVKQIDFGDSKSIAQLKIADWVAGAARDVAMSKLNPPRKEVSQELSEIAESWLAGRPLWLDQNWLADRLGISDSS